jgi:hypothetical protein
MWLHRRKFSDLFLHFLTYKMGALLKFGDFTVKKMFGTAEGLLQLQWQLKKLHQLQEHLESSSSYSGSRKSYSSGRNSWGAPTATLAAGEAKSAAGTAGELL